MALILSFPNWIPLDPILAVPLLIALACVVLLVLGAMIRALRRRVSEAAPLIEQQSTETPEAAPASETVSSSTSPPSHPPAEQTAGFWWLMLLRGEAVLGVVFAAFQPIILIINSYILSLRLEVLFGRVGDPLFTLGMIGWHREITIFDIVGCLISTMQILLAAAYVNTAGKAGRRRWTSRVALWALASTIALEVGLSFYCGLPDGYFVATLNSMLAQSVALTDVLCGVFLIEHLLIPLILAVAWSIASPFRAVARMVMTRAAKPSAARPAQPAKAYAHGKAVGGRWAINALDEFFRAVLLRDLDAFFKRRARSKKQFQLKKVKEEVCIHPNS